MLFVDIGNTNIKIWTIEGNAIENPEDDSVLIASVNRKKMEDFLSSYNFNNVFVVDIDKIPIKIVYNGKVGIDRVIVSLPFLGEKCYIVDAGSMITVDKLDGFTLYPGPIIPGFNIIEKDVFDKIDGIKPNSDTGTLENLERGICSVVQCSVDMFVEDDLPVYVTGGSSVCFKNGRYIIKNNLMFEGLRLCGVNGWYKDLR